MLRLEPGDELVPGHRLVKWLGSGRFGEVWEAQAEFGVRKALKLVDLRGYEAAGNKEYRGIQRIKDIRHSNLMQITDIWMLDEDWNVLQERDIQSSDDSFDRTVVLDRDRKEPAVLVVGMPLGDTSLEERLQKCSDGRGQAIPLRELLDYMEEAAKGIDFLNLNMYDPDRGHVPIQHCDIKPANLMLVGNSVQICDFGLAHVLADHQTTLTAVGGTPAYMAPEVLTNRTPTPRTDQYSLACTYCHLRTGSLPFDGETSKSGPAMCNAHQNGTLDFSAVEGRSERNVLKKATSRDFHKRYDSCRAFVRALREAIDEDIGIARQSGKERRGILRRRIAAVSISVLLVCLAGYGIYHREPIVHAVAHLVQSLSDPGESNPGQSGKDRRPDGSERSFDDAFWEAKQAFGADDYERAFAKLRELKEKFPEHGQEVAERHREWLEQLLDDQHGKLNEVSARSDVDVLEAGDVFTFVERECPDDGCEDLLWRAILGQARVAAREQRPENRWDNVKEQLDRLSGVEVAGSKRDSFEEGAAIVLDVLFHTSSDIKSFFTDPVLDELVKLNSLQWSGDRGAWEEVKLAELMDAAVEVLKQNPDDVAFSGSREDERLKTIFGGSLDLLWQLSDVRKALLNDSPLDPSEFDIHRDTLDQIEEELSSQSADGPSGVQFQAQLNFLEALLGVRDRRFSLEDAVKLARDIHPASPGVRYDHQQKLVECLLVRMELDVTEKGVPLSAIELLDDYEQRRVYMDAQEETRYRAVKTVQTLWRSEVNTSKYISSVLSQYDSFQSAKVLPASIKTVIDGMWLECQLLGSRPDPNTSNKMKNKATVLEEKQKQNHGFVKDYIGFVLVFYSVTGQDSDRENKAVAERRAAASLDPFLDTLAERPFAKQSRRKSFLATLLLKAAHQLKENVEALEGPAYGKEEAKKAVRYLSFSTAVFDASPDQVRQARPLNILALYYSDEDGNESESLRLFDSVKPDPGHAADGHLLLVRALVLNQLHGTPDFSSDATIVAMGEFLEWEAVHLKHEYGATVYRTIIAPGIKIAAEYYEPQFENMVDRSRPMIIKGEIAVPVRKSLALLYHRLAQLIDVNLEVSQEAGGAKELDQVGERYYRWRAAAALDPEVAAYPAGQSWATMELWLIEGETEKHLSGEDSEAYLAEMNVLSSRALDIEPDNPFAAAVRAVCFHEKARSSSIGSSENAKNLYSEAVECYTQALKSSEFSGDLRPVARSELLARGSSANVEYANLLFAVLKQRESMAPYLDAAIRWAREACQERLLPNPHIPLIAWGNAAEDLAYFCGRDPQDNYEMAVDKFSEAVKAANDSGSENLAIGGRGRCRYRWAKTIHEGLLSPTDGDADLEEVLGQAIADLTTATESNGEKSFKAECHFFLGAAYILLAEVNLEAAETALDNADEALKNAVDLGGDYRWQEYQVAWIRHAFKRGQRKQVESRVQDFVETRSSDERRVDHAYKFKAIRYLYEAYGSSIEERQDLVEQYLETFPVEGPNAGANAVEARHYRFKLLMLYANQVRHLLDSELPPDIREQLEGSVPDFQEYADTAEELMDKNNAADHLLEEMRELATFAYALSIYYDHTGKELENAARIRHATRLLDFAAALVDARQDSLSQIDVAQWIECAMESQKGALSVRAEGEDDKQWMRRKQNVLEVSRQFEQAKLSKKQKEALGKKIEDIETLEFPEKAG